MRFLANIFLGTALLITSCSSPEAENSGPAVVVKNPDIELSKDVLKAYLSQNWDAYYDYYADSAQIWRNQNWLHDDGMTVDQYVENLRQGLQQIDSYTFHGETWSQITSEVGENWVLFWGVWIGKSSVTGKTYEVPVHVAMMIDKGKIVGQGDFFNMTEYTLDMMKFAAQQP